ncbi:hypothetical protein HK104_000562 [Borealophlyctis nickersoniae]|nr:hypothetical protein HK104_000562 [Borealophlyctis nickersoniae]
MPPCNAAPGQFVVDSPRSNTLAQVSAPLNISWHYSDLTNKQRFPARKVSIFYQFADDNNPKAEWKLIADVNRTFTNYTWTVPSAQDGQYMVRLVADDFDLMQNPSLTCYPDTFPAASSSAKFKIMNSAPLANYPDTMGPSMGGAERNPVWLGIVAVAAILVFSVFEVWV